MGKTNWDLTYFYKDEPSFEADLSKFRKRKDELSSYKGKLGEEAKLAEYLRLYKQTNVELAHLYYYASMDSDLDKKDVKRSERLSKVEYAISELSEATSFDSPELLALGKERIDSFIVSKPEFKEFSFFFDKLFKKADHVLSEDKERLLSAYSPLLGSAADLYSQLTVADREDEEIVLDGEKTKVTMANWTSLVKKAKTAEGRQKVFEALYSYYDKHKTAYAGIYNLSLQSQLAVKKSRGYKSILDTHLHGDAIPEGVFETLIEVASSNTAPLKEYYEIRRKALGLTKHRSYDRFLPLAESNRNYTYEEAKETFFDSIKRFDADFQEKAHEVLQDGFVDVYPSSGKRTGAYSNGGYGLHPYILLNFNGELNDVFTLAHESGHSIHTLYSEESQPIMDQDYTIFVAEIASTFNEHNLLDYLLKQDDLSKDDKIFLLQKSIDEICSTFYRQTLFAHFERDIALLAEQGKPINYAVLNAKMRELYLGYYGIDIEEERLKPLVWAYIPHLFYTPFYVYQYATSFTSSLLLYEKVNNGEEGAFDRYIGLLRSGGSDYPVEQVRKAGVDLTSKEPFLAVIRRMEQLVKKLKDLLGQ